MIKRATTEMQITERELIAMTNQLDETHRATLPTVHEAVAEWTELNHQLRRAEGGGRRPNRRSFLLGSGAAVGGLVLAACSTSNPKTSTSGGPTTATTVASGGTANPYSGDLAVAALAASLENLAVQTYQAALDAAKAGSLGTVPAAIGTFATTVMGQHNEHAGAWNSILTSAGKPVVTQVDITVKTAFVKPGLAAVKDVPGLARFALALEDVAAATYLNGMQSVLMAQSAIRIAATIQPVEMQHSAILHFVLGDYPVPDAFAKIDGARGPSDKLG